MRHPHKVIGPILHKTLSLIIWQLPYQLAGPDRLNPTGNTTLLHFDHTIWILQIWTLLIMATLILICELMLSSFRIYWYPCFWFQNIIQIVFIYIAFLLELDFSWSHIFACLTHWGCSSAWLVLATQRMDVGAELRCQYSCLPILAIVELDVVDVHQRWSSLFMVVCFYA